MSTAFITGASGGIGSAIALRLAKEGYNIVAAYFSDEGSAKKIEAKIKEMGRECLTLKLNVASPEEVTKAFEEAKNKIGEIDVLVNCAGAAMQKLFTDTTDDDFDYLTGVNFKGVFNTCKCAVPNMVKNHKGKIINISSMWGTYGASCEVLYSATKAGVIGLTKALARELAPSNIQVNCIAPGAIDTKMNNNLSKEDKASFAEEIPMGRFGLPEEIAGAVSFLASDESNYLTAQVITIDGGLT